MRGFLYYLPGAKPSDVPGNLRAWGLSHLVDDGTKLHSRGCTRGPGECGPGLVVGSSVNFEPEQVKLDLDACTWQKFPKVWARSEGVAEPWLGYYTDSGLPAESDLARSHQISGERWKSPDGQEWLIPHARVITSDGPASNLPISFTLDDETGDWIAGQVLPKYRELWKHSNACLDAMVTAAAEAAKTNADTGYTWTIPDHRPLIEESFKVNYRVSEMELAALGLLVTGVAADIAEIITDARGWERIKKKAVVDTGAG